MRGRRYGAAAKQVYLGVVHSNMVYKIWRTATLLRTLIRHGCAVPPSPLKGEGLVLHHPLLGVVELGVFSALCQQLLVGAFL